MNQFSQLQLTYLHKEFDILQKKYGDISLDSIYGAGCISNPDIMFIFMNPTGRNVASKKEWLGLKAPWLGTKNIWKLFKELDVISIELYSKIIKIKPQDWDYEFVLELYNYIKNKKVYITNLGKCTQTDARPLSNLIFKNYLELLEMEIYKVNPKVIITFGNQVSSIILNRKISVSVCRNNYYIKNVKDIEYKIYPVYYPIGQGMRNINIAINDIKKIMEINNIK